MNAVKRSAAWGRWSAPLAAALLLGATGVASAQDVEPVVRRWGVKVGAFLPLNGTLRNQADDIGWSAGLEYYPNFRARPLNGDIYFALDFAGSDSGAGFLSSSLSTRIVWLLNAPEARYRVYGGVGVGAAIINTGFIGATTQPIGKIILGVDVTDRLFLEANLDWVGGFTDNLGNGVRTDGVSVSVGARF